MKEDRYIDLPRAAALSLEYLSATVNAGMKDLVEPSKNGTIHTDYLEKRMVRFTRLAARQALKIIGREDPVYPEWRIR